MLDVDMLVDFVSNQIVFVGIRNTSRWLLSDTIVSNIVLKRDLRNQAESLSTVYGV